MEATNHQQKPLIIIVAVLVVSLIILAIVSFILLKPWQNNSYTTEGDTLLSFSFQTQADAQKPLIFESVKKSSTTTPTPLAEGELYTLSIMRDNKELHQQEFTVPIIYGEVINPRTGKFEPVGSVKSDAIQITTPYFEPGFRALITQGDLTIFDQTITEIDS